MVLKKLILYLVKTRNKSFYTIDYLVLSILNDKVSMHKKHRNKRNSGKCNV